MFTPLFQAEVTNNHQNCLYLSIASHSAGDIDSDQKLAFKIFIPFSIAKSIALISADVVIVVDFHTFNDAILAYGFTQTIHFQLLIVAHTIHAKCVP
jgi:hypothetical protein